MDVFSNLLSEYDFEAGSISLLIRLLAFHSCVAHLLTTTNNRLPVILVLSLLPVVLGRYCNSQHNESDGGSLHSFGTEICCEHTRLTDFLFTSSKR